MLYTCLLWDVMGWWKQGLEMNNAYFRWCPAFPEIILECRVLTQSSLQACPLAIWIRGASAPQSASSMVYAATSFKELKVCMNLLHFAFFKGTCAVYSSVPLLAAALWHVDPALPLEQMHGGAADMTSLNPALCNLCTFCVHSYCLCLPYILVLQKLAHSRARPYTIAWNEQFFILTVVTKCEQMWSNVTETFTSNNPGRFTDSCLTNVGRIRKKMPRRFEDSRSWRRWSQSAGEEEAWALNEKEHKEHRSAPIRMHDPSRRSSQC